MLPGLCARDVKVGKGQEPWFAFLENSGCSEIMLEEDMRTEGPHRDGLQQHMSGHVQRWALACVVRNLLSRGDGKTFQQAHGYRIGGLHR